MVGSSSRSRQSLGPKLGRLSLRGTPAASPDKWTHRSGLTAGGQPVNCGCGCSPRTAGGALSLAGMGRGGYAPRIYARPELIHDEVFAPSFHQGPGCYWRIKFGYSVARPLGTHRSVAVAGVDLGWCERVAGLLFMPVPQEKAGKQTPSRLPSGRSNRRSRTSAFPRCSAGRCRAA